MLKIFVSVATLSAVLFSFDVNIASVKDLEKIHGIGDASAKKIVEYRTKNGNYKNLEDVKKSGIVTAVYNALVKHAEDSKKYGLPSTQNKPAQPQTATTPVQPAQKSAVAPAPTK
jgi:competence protein ComEA